MFSLYRGRSSTKKKNHLKPKISAAERQKRLAKKKLSKLFSSWRTFHPGCSSRNVAKKNSAPPGAESRVEIQNIYQHSISLNKMPSAQKEYGRTGI